MKIKRNDPCHCGSEKKFKDCHGKKAVVNPWKKIAIYITIGLIVFWFFKDIFSTGSDSIGSAPPGKVWSEEHGHYHDVNTNRPPIPPMPSGAQKTLNIPQPEGPVPEGKVWSREHGHWHDIVNN
tara:strand:- start:171 stop:542 length:372 start_codon:yes stop_codon:yes gene_type:complete